MEETRLHPAMPRACHVMLDNAGKRFALWDGESYALERASDGTWVSLQCVFHSGHPVPKGGF